MSRFLIGIDFIFECNSRLFHALTTPLKKGPVAQRIRHLILIFFITLMITCWQDW